MAQDFTVFNMLRTYSIELWEQQMGIILAQHGLMSFIAHPDYLLSAPAQAAYRSLLVRLAALRDDQGVWLPRPGELAAWWRDRAATGLVRSGEGWAVEGPAQDRARIAYAYLEEGRIRYQIG